LGLVIARHFADCSLENEPLIYFDEEMGKKLGQLKSNDEWRSLMIEGRLYDVFDIQTDVEMELFDEPVMVVSARRKPD
jgi:hypothetical protein